MVHSIQFFTSITSIVQISSRLPNGDMAKVTHVGIVQVSPTLSLENVLCIPSFSFNLISISKITQIHLVVVFSFHNFVSFKTYSSRRWLGWVRCNEAFIHCKATLLLYCQHLFLIFLLSCLGFLFSVSTLVFLKLIKLAYGIVG